MRDISNEFCTFQQDKRPRFILLMESPAFFSSEMWRLWPQQSRSESIVTAVTKFQREYPQSGR